MKKFKKVYIEITNVCNLSCSFCPKTKRKLEFLSVDKFKQVMDQVSKYTEHVYFHLMGEPFLNNNIEEFLKIANQYGLKVNITTNGTLLADIKEKLVNYPALRQVNISLHSFEANKGDITLDKYVNDVCDFINEVNKKSKIISSIRLWNIDTEELKAQNSLNDNIFNIIEKKLNLEFSIKEKLLEKSRVKLKDNVYLNMAEKFKWPDISENEEEEEVFCYGLRDQFGILVDGTVVPCCLDSEGNIPLGNIYDESLDNILNSKRATDIYEGFSRRKATEELCKKCGYATRYKRK